MKKRTVSVFLLIFLLISLAASLLSFAAVSHRNTNDISARLEKDFSDIKSLENKASSRKKMKVCSEKMNYYQNASFEGDAIGEKTFGYVLYAEEYSDGVMRIYTENGAVLGYCEASALIGADAMFFAEIPYEWNESGQVSKLVDIRKYIMLFDADLLCDSETPILIQYDTMLKLFDAAKSFSISFGYKLMIEKAYIPSSNGSGCKCLSACPHASGACIALSMVKKGESTSVSIPIYADETAEILVDSEFAELLAKFSLIHGDSGCFYDSSYSSYMITDHDLSSLIYSIWE